MEKPILIVMAAGMGSRFGALKQIIPVDEQGHALMDYSLFDARRAGFERVVFLIKHELEPIFRETIGARMEKYFDVRYVFQELDELPAGYAVPEGREKPWGTGHAIACCRHAADAPFAVVNADDYYGAGAYRAMYDFLRVGRQKREFAMVGYRLRNTLTDFGTVSRGVCTVKDGCLISVREYTKIARRGQDAAYTENGIDFVDISGDTTVSMNLWGFSDAMPKYLWEQFPAFLDRALRENPLRAEYQLPGMANTLLAEGRCTVRVLECGEVWHGMTYREDLDNVKASIAEMKKTGLYPDRLWE